MKEKENVNVKKKVKIKILPLLIFLVICACMYVLITFLLDLKITNIYIVGNSIVSDQEIIELAGIQDYPSFIKTSSSSMEKKILENDYIYKVDINKKMFGVVLVNVVENTPVLIDLNNKLVLSDGTVVENSKNIVAPSLINYVPDVKYKSLIKKLVEVDPVVFSEISEIKYDKTDQDKDRFGLLMNDGNLVYVTLTKFSNINYYNDIISGITCKKGILNLDSGNHFEVKEDYCK